MANSRFWNYTRGYMMTGRINPSPAEFTADLTKNRITNAEKAALIAEVQAWAGGTAAIKAATVADIQRAKAAG